MTTCPCDLARPYASCCGRWHHGPERLRAPDAAALMRSRYAAFVLEDEAYLLDTWHPSTRPARIEFDPGTHWLGLQVRSQHHEGCEASVEFVARSRHGGRATRLHERSRFLRSADGRWQYVDGDLSATGNHPR